MGTPILSRITALPGDHFAPANPGTGRILCVSRACRRYAGRASKSRNRRAGLWRKGISKLPKVRGGVLREKTLQPVASNNQLTSVAYNQVLAFKAGEIFGYPR